MQVKVYLITNQITGKKYVGQTSRTIARRFWEHANNNKSAIGLAIQKYGRENFNIKVLEICASSSQYVGGTKASCTDARRSSRSVVCFREGKNIGRGQTPRKRKSTAAKVRKKIRSGKATGSYSRRTR